MKNFSQCKNFNDVFTELNKMADKMPFAPKKHKQGMGDKYALIGFTDMGAEFITLLDVEDNYKQFISDKYEKIIIYKEWEVIK